VGDYAKLTCISQKTLGRRQQFDTGAGYIRLIHCMEDLSRVLDRSHNMFDSLSLFVIAIFIIFAFFLPRQDRTCPLTCQPRPSFETSSKVISTLQSEVKMVGSENQNTKSSI
jgi:hypothetical protein